VLGEIVPKSLAVAHAERVARVTLPLIKLLNFFVYPVTVLMGLVNQLVLRVFSASDSENTATAVTQPELRIILSGAKQSGALELYEQDMI
jgi:CBS domain containing-hemolysin-like protein